MKIESPKFFRIEQGDVGTEAYQDCYVHDLKSAVQKQRDKIAQLMGSFKELDRSYQMAADKANFWKSEWDKARAEIARLRAELEELRAGRYENTTDIGDQ